MEDLDLKALAYVLAQQMKEYHRQRNAYMCVLQHLKDSGVPGIDSLEKSALAAPEILAATETEFQFLEKWLPPIPEVDRQTVRRLWLEKWQPAGKKPH